MVYLIEISLQKTLIIQFHFQGVYFEIIVIILKLSFYIYTLLSILLLYIIVEILHF